MQARAMLRKPAPVLLCTDIQQEYLAPGRHHAMADTAQVLATCKKILDQWRSRLWPVVHLKRVARAAWFNPASTLTDWVPECRPRPGEMSFEHPLPSAYSSPRFVEYQANLGITGCVVIGFSLEEAVLATVIDGFHRGHDLKIIGEAIACAPLDGCELTQYRRVLLDLIGNFAGIEPLDRAIASTAHPA